MADYTKEQLAEIGRVAILKQKDRQRNAQIKRLATRELIRNYQDEFQELLKKYSKEV